MIDTEILATLERELDPATLTRLDLAVEKIVEAKARGGKVAVVTGSGPNLHEGVTTLIAELMRTGLVDGVTTSSAVVAHEMGGTLDKVKGCRGAEVGVAEELLPCGGEFELSLVSDASLREIQETAPAVRTAERSDQNRRRAPRRNWRSGALPDVPVIVMNPPELTFP